MVLNRTHFVAAESTPAANFGAVAFEADCFELRLPNFAMTSQRGLDGRARACERKLCSARLVRLGQQLPHALGEERRRAQVQRTLATIVTIAERVVRSAARSTDVAPGRDDGALRREQVRAGLDEPSRGVEPLVNKIRFFHSDVDAAA
jgi:hypothetical protein